MLDARFMQQLSAQYLNDDAVLARIHAAAAQGDVGVSFTLAELTPGVITTLRDAGYTVKQDTFYKDGLHVWVGWW